MIRQFQERVDILKEVLSEQAGNDSLQDKFHTGYIAGLNELLKIEFSEEKSE